MATCLNFRHPWDCPWQHLDNYDDGLHLIQLKFKRGGEGGLYLKEKKNENVVVTT